MTFVRSFDDAKPPRRFDGIPFSAVEIQESAAFEGPFVTVETMTLVPVDDDPADPLARDLTTALAVEEDGWYRLNWIDSNGANYVGDPIRYGSSTTAALVRPTVADVAILLRTRTVGGVSTGLGADTGPGYTTTFTANTRPTALEVGQVIDHALDEVMAQLPRDPAEEHWPGIRRVIALRAAGTIESSFFREDGQGSDLTAAYLSDLQALHRAIPREVAIAREFSERETAELLLRG